MENINKKEILKDFDFKLNSTKTIEELEKLKKYYFGKKGIIKIALSNLKLLSTEERPKMAIILNEIKSKIINDIDIKINQINQDQMSIKLKNEWQDITLPGITRKKGHKHPVTEIEEKIMDVLRRLDFKLIHGPEVDSAYYTFDALNIPEHHPARDMQDTFWLNDKYVLRTHTTTVQARVLEENPSLPIRVASAGRVFRNEAVDATHLAMFHQFEGFWIDKNLTFSHLKGLLTFIAKELFGNYPIRFKPKYYPYTEPSVGVDMQCGDCKGKGCNSCHNAGWVTIIGSGMVHPKVLKEFGFNPNEITGIAFGFGTTRMASQLTGVGALRSLYKSDQRILKAIYRGEKYEN